MTFTPQYTSESLIEAFLQVDIDATTKPTTAQVLQWIEEVEDELTAQNLGSQTATDQYIDVYPTSTLTAGTSEWLKYITQYGYSLDQGRIVVPPLVPIIAVTKMYKNESDLGSAVSWTELTEGPGSGSDFIILKKKTRAGLMLGSAFYFYGDTPSSGYQKLKCTYTYGYNLNATSRKILTEYATLRVSEKVIIALKRSGQPTAITTYVGPDLQTFVTGQLEQDLDYSRFRCNEVEIKFFPKEMAFGSL